MSRGPILLTGATGFVGMELLVRLLERGDRDVVALVRAADDRAAQVRIDGVLDTLFAPDAVGAMRGRVRALAGDLERRDLGLGAEARDRLTSEISAVAHCAASISFDLSLEDARRINVAGTNAVLRLAREARDRGALERFVHVSTAYVAGDREGRVGESERYVGQRFRNTYEQTKLEAESLVDASGLPASILRPSIVVGDSVTGWTPSFNVIYWPLLAFARDLLPTVAADPDARVDVVCVDTVADALHTLLDGPLQQGTLHAVAGDDAVTNAELAAMAAGAFGRDTPRFVAPGEDPRSEQRAGVFAQYFRSRLEFDARRGRRARLPPPAAEGVLRRAHGLRGPRPLGQGTAAPLGGRRGGGARMTTATAPRRLSALDGSFLRLDTLESPMHVGWSAVFAAPAGGRPRPTVAALRKRAASRLHEVPWCRWRLAGAPLGLSEPRWIDDADFDLAAHVVQLTGDDDPVSDETFETLRGTVLSAPLDRSRPLWQVSLVPLLEDGRVGVIGKIHHALVDGIAALQIARLFVDPEPDPDVPAGPAEEPWSPAGDGGPAGWVLDAARHAIGDGAGALRAGSAAVTHPRSAVAAAAREARLLGTAVAEEVLPAAPASQLNGRIGPRRALVGYRAPAELVRAARGAGGTLNDVGLAAVAGALRELALKRGDPCEEPLKAMVPVSMRSIGEEDAGNQISMVYVALPVHLATAAQRLASVREETERLKHSDRPEATQSLTQAAGLVPPVLRTPLVRALAAPRQFNLTVSQPPAPRGSLYLLGCELEEIYSVIPIAQGHALAIGMVRYNRELFFGCYADPDALPEVHELPDLLAAELEELAAAGSR